MATFMAALHQRSATPITPLHSPRPSLHSQSSVTSHPQSLSLHEYRKQLSLPCTPDLVGSKRVKRKTAASSLKSTNQSPRVTFAEQNQLPVGDQVPSVRRPSGDEAQPLLSSRLHLHPRRYCSTPLAVNTRVTRRTRPFKAKIIF
ncbi:hypothetical protein BC567DRAFT_207990 [Phyllosticta citribraziliensis]